MSYVVQNCLQRSEAENDTNRDLCVTIELNIPEKGYWQQSAEPVRGNVDSRRSVVDVRKCLCWIAFPSWSSSVPCVRHRRALENDVQHGNEIHDDEHP